MTRFNVVHCFLLGTLLAGAAGCYTTRVHTGMAGTAPSLMATERWHHTLVAGIAEIAPPVDLEGVCPGGWATIDENYSFLNWLVGGVTFGIYTPITYTVVCAGGGAAPAAAPGAAWGAPPPGAPPAPPPAPR